MSTASDNDSTRPAITIFQTKNVYEPPLLVLVAAFLCALYLLCPNAADPDLWGHVRYGQDAWAQDTIHRTTTYSYLATDQSWINHESIAEWTMGWIGPRFGGAGLMLMKAALGAYTLGLLHLIIRRRTWDSLASCILLIAGAWAMRFYWGTRPQLFSFASFATVLFLLDQGFAAWFNYHQSSDEPDTNNDDGQNRNSSININYWPLTFLPVTIGFWTNAHGGFIVGVAVASLLLGGRFLQSFLRSRTFQSKHFLQLSLILALVVASTLCTPYQLDLWYWIAGSLGVQRPEILEWAAWDYSPAGQRLLFVTGLIGLAIALSRKPKDWVELAVIGLLTWQSIKHMRHSPFLVMALMAWGAPHLRSSCRRLQSMATDLHGQLSGKANEEQTQISVAHPEGLPTHRWVRRSQLVNLVAGGMCCWFGFLLWNQCSTIRVDHQRYPVAAFAFMKQHQLSGRTMITFNWAQYAIDALCPPLRPNDSECYSSNSAAIPQLKTTLTSASSPSHSLNSITIKDAPLPVTSIAVDGRFRTAYHQNLIDWHFDFLIGNQRPRQRADSSGPIDPGKMLSLGEPELIVLERRNTVSCQTMLENAQHWVCLYRDSIAEIWGRRSIYDDPENRNFIPEEERFFSEASQPYWSAWPAK